MFVRRPRRRQLGIAQHGMKNEVPAGALHDRGLTSAFLVSDPWHNARIEAIASDVGIAGYASATWTSADTTEETRGRAYLRETFAYLYYRLFGS